MSRHVDQAWVPQGWVIEEFPRDPDIVVLNRPQDTGGGMVSIDFTKRVFDGGYQMPRNFPQDVERKKYGGRGWKEQLARDASSWLEKAMTTIPHSSSKADADA